jgi:WD40 repeat protein
LAGWITTLPSPRPPLQHPGIVANVGFNPDGGKVVALSTGSVGLEDQVMPGGQKGKFLVARPTTVGDPFFEKVISSPFPTAANVFRPRPLSPATARGRIFIWDVAGGTPVSVKSPPDSLVLAVTPDGKMVLTAKRQDRFSSPSTVQIWNLYEGKAQGEVIKFNFPIQWAVCSGDGKTFVALVRDTLFLWDATTGQRLKELHVDGLETSQKVLSPDGKVLAVVTMGSHGPGAVAGDFMPGMNIPGVLKQGKPGTIALYDLVARKQLMLWHGAYQHSVDAEAAVAVGPGGRLVLTASPSNGMSSGAVHLWYPEAKKERQLPYQGRLAFAQFSPDGNLLLTASGRGLGDVSEAVRLWDTATGQPLGASLLPRGEVRTAAFSPDGKLLAIGTGKGEVQLWEATTGRPLARPLRHPGAVFAITFSPDGTKLVTGGYDGTARIWDTHPTKDIHPLRALERVAYVSADGSRYIFLDETRMLRLYDMTSGKPCGEPVPYTEKDRGMLVAPDKRTLVIINEGNRARLWDAVTGKPIGEPLSHLAPVARICFMPDGRTLLTYAKIDDLEIASRWETSTGRSLGRERNTYIKTALNMSPDGRWALCTYGPSARVVDISTAGGALKDFEHVGSVTGGVFSPDSRTLLTTSVRSGSWEEARLWDVATGKVLGPPMPHQGPIRARVFSRDGKKVLTGSDDGTARLWDAATGKQLGPPMQHGGRVTGVTLHPDSKLAATAGDDGLARIWHVTTGQPLGPPLPHPSAVSHVAFGTEGETLITGSGDIVRVWKVPQPVQGEAKRLLLEAEIETGLELDGSTPRLLDDEERAQRVRQMQQVDNSPPAGGSR